MAKIEYSALVNRIRGRVSHSVISYWKGLSIVKRHNGSPRQPRSSAQQAVRGLLNDLAGEWYALSSTQKDLWNAWVSMVKLPMTGLNAYVKFNQILQKYFPGTARKTSPPATPDTPEHPQTISATAITGTDVCFAWENPVSADETMVVDMWAMPGLDLVTHPRWAFAGCAGADALAVTIATTYPVGTVIKFRSRVVDTDGRVSPWSHTVSATLIT